MTLLEAVESLGIVEVAAVSSMNIRPIEAIHIVRFTMALLLPFSDPALPEYLRAGPVRLWPDQERLLDSPRPIQSQLHELQASGLLGNLAVVHVSPKNAPMLRVIETHAGSREERLSWLRSVIRLEGRTPVG